MNDEVNIGFADLALPDAIFKATQKLGFDSCTEVQRKVLPYSLSEYDISAQAQTGTGKTAAFLTTILTRHIEHPLANKAKLGSPRALVLAPTRELALQIESDALALGKYCKPSVVALVGGISIGKQQNELRKQPVEIIVATPGRLIDFLDRQSIDLSQVEILVIDEADRLLDMGFIPSVRKIVRSTPHKNERQTMFFSATFNDEVLRLAEQWTQEGVHIEVQPDSIVAKNVEQLFWIVEKEAKIDLLVEFLARQKPEHTLVFVNMRIQVKWLVDRLRAKGFACDGLSGDMPQKKRLKVLDRFKRGHANLLVATDVAGRGLHVEGISHVVNYELPEVANDYVHRIGRTGRVEARGTAISFISERDAFLIHELEQVLGHDITCSYPEHEPIPVE